MWKSAIPLFSVNRVRRSTIETGKYEEVSAMSVTLSLPEARRLAIASQGFSTRPPAPSVADLRKLAGRLHTFQIDSVNVLVRAHRSSYSLRWKWARLERGNSRS